MVVGKALRHPRPRWVRGESGQAAAEFAVVAPLVLLILMATIAFGHLLYTRMIVVQAANRAARLGAVLYGDSDISRHKAKKETERAAYGLLESAPRGETDVRVRTVGSDLHVTVVYRSSVPVPFVGDWMGDAIHIAHTAVYRIEKDHL